MVTTATCCAQKNVTTCAKQRQQVGDRWRHYIDVIMSTMASQITSLAIVYSTVYSGADQRKHQSSVSLAFVRGIHRWPVNYPHKGPVTREMFPFDNVIMCRMDKQTWIRMYASYPRVWTSMVCARLVLTIRDWCEAHAADMGCVFIFSDSLNYGSHCKSFEERRVGRFYLLTPTL